VLPTTGAFHPITHLSVRPGYFQAESGKPWLLKLHGTAQTPQSAELEVDDIVLTRHDYRRQTVEHGALFGIVQAMLATQHLLFVGYSLNDEDFHELADEIRAALGSALQDGRKMGTVLVVDESPTSPLWEDLFDIQPIAPRELKLLLDRVANLSNTTHMYLLDDTFEEMLDDDEGDLKKAIREVEKVVDRLPDHPTAKAVGNALAPFRPTLDR
jgi:hypothetical protein